MMLLHYLSGPTDGLPNYALLSLCPEVIDCVPLMDSMPAVGHLPNECLSVRMILQFTC